MKYDLYPYIKNTEAELLLEDMRRAAKRLRKKTLTIDEYEQTGTYHFHTITRRFGTWNKALTCAGLGIKKHYNIPAQALFENIGTLWQKLGRQPHLNDLCAPSSRFSRRPYLRVFGTWRNALEKFGKYKHRRGPGKNRWPLNGSAIHKTGLHLTKRSVAMGLRFRVMRRDNFRCVACGRTPAIDPHVVLHVDHIKPWHSGGETVFENLQTLCSICNIGKSNLAA